MKDYVLQTCKLWKTSQKNGLLEIVRNRYKHLWGLIKNGALLFCTFFFYLYVCTHQRLFSIWTSGALNKITNFPVKIEFTWFLYFQISLTTPNTRNKALNNSVWRSFLKKKSPSSSFLYSKKPGRWTRVLFVCLFFNFYFALMTNLGQKALLQSNPNQNHACPLGIRKLSY